MVSSVSQISNSLAYEMAQIGASSSLTTSSKIEKLTYNGLSQEEKESLRQKYATVLEEYTLDDIDSNEEIEEAQGNEENYLNLENKNQNEFHNSNDIAKSDVSSQDEISYFADKYSELSDEVAPHIASAQSNLFGYSKFNYNKITSAYFPKSTSVQSNVKVYA